MFESLSQRTVIIGNSGAGKNALAESLAALVHVPVIDLDLLNWEGDDYGRKRDEDAARRMTLEVSAQPLWIIEGVYGWLADVALPRATALIWLDFPRSLCRAGLLARGPRRGAECLPILPAPNSDWRPGNRRLYCSLTYVLATQSKKLVGLSIILLLQAVGPYFQGP